MQDTNKSNIYYIKTYSYNSDFIKCRGAMDTLYSFLKYHYSRDASLQTLMDRVHEYVKTEQEYWEEKRVTINWEKEWEIDRIEAKRLLPLLEEYIDDQWSGGYDFNIKYHIDKMRYDDRQGDNS